MKAHSPQVSAWSRGLALLLWAGFAGVLGLWLVGLVVSGELEGAGRMHLLAFWVAFMARTFGFHMGLGLGLMVVLAAVVRRRRLAGCAAVLGAVLAGPGVVSGFRSSPAIPGGVGAGAPVLTVMSANLLVGHADEDALLAEIARHDPDLLIFQEYTPAKADVLVRALAARYPHRHEAMRGHAFGGAVFSRLPFVGEPEDAPHAELRADAGLREGGVVGIQDPQIRVVVEFAGAPVVVQNIHDAPPIGGSYLAEQRRFIGWLARWAAAEPRAVLIAGDFNSTPESVNAADLRAAGLTEAHAAAGVGRGGTWPTDGPLSWVPRVRIDQVWARGLRCVSSVVGEPNASDHRPVVAKYVLAHPR